MSERQDEMRRRNLAQLKHEAETPMRGHDEAGVCCVRAKYARDEGADDE